MPAPLPAWHSPAQGHDPLSTDLTADVCVVGLGGSGLAAITELCAAGADVIGIDAAELAGGAAGRNGGFLLAGLADFHHDAVARHGRERAVELYRQTIAEIARMAAETPEDVRITGSLRIAHDDEERADCERQLAVMREDDLPVEWYDGPEGSGLLVPTDGVFHPLNRCRTLARAAVARGARLFEHSPALTIAPGLVATPGGRVRCRRIIVALDGALGRVLPELAPRVRTARLQMLATAPDADGNAKARSTRPIYARWGLDYWQRRPDGRLFLGGFRDVAEADEWTDDPTPSAPVQAALERFLRESLGVTTAITHRWAAIVSYAADGMPVMEEVRPGVWAIGGYSGTGNVLGALYGRRMAHEALR